MTILTEDFTDLLDIRTPTTEPIIEEVTEPMLTEEEISTAQEVEFTIEMEELLETEITTLIDATRPLVEPIAEEEQQLTDVIILVETLEER